ncbi:hypothetical protein [Campylobacter ureolyticus]|uniref:hypothetical protein n=1 Tax=Campylobacter ureolyticus TaxID=827 RepID=UPI001FC86C54|nr:hypothetical protein [Campylobacter ureolyticus]MCZ6105370.1 hypothetical protein [Campylobacter ureolyticus]MCZ6157585.1 hypothetical protein [Campylobacter ureolyticus]GKH60870.1 hypothetical protein CE91St25_12060 [Campylobacter ureolyticus]
MEKRYSYRDICTGGYCHFYKFDAKNLDELNKLIISASEIDQNEFLRKYGKIFEPKDAQILDKDGKLMHTIIFNNEKNMYFKLHLPDAFSIITQDGMKVNKNLMDRNKIKGG